MAAERIRASLIAFCAAGGNAVERALELARGLGSGGEPPAGRIADAASLPCALVVGWATGPAETDRRKALVATLTGSPEEDGRAPAAAAAIAAMGSYAVAKAPLLSVMAAGIEEAGAYGAGDLTSAAVGSWSAPDGGVPPEPLPTVAAVIAALRAGEGSPAGAAGAADAMDGDTRVVAALASAIAAARTGEAGAVNGAGVEPDLAPLADALSALRA